MDWLYQFRSHLFGDCPPNLVGIHLEVTPLGKVEASQLKLDMRIQPHTITLPDGMRLNRSGVRHQQEMIVSNHAFNQKPIFVLNRVKYILHLCRYQFREQDPRIGSLSLSYLLPLVDEAEIQKNNRCSLCGLEHDSSTMWGGWNLLWVHQNCWVQVQSE